MTVLGLPGRRVRRQARRRIAGLLIALMLAPGSLLATAPGVGLGVGSVSAATVCGEREYEHGIDVSKYQGKVDWPRVRASGVTFGVARIADGITFPDATFQGNYAGMRAAGITPGSYFFFEPAQDPTAQANLVLSALATAGFAPGDLPPVIDVEVTGGQTPATIATRLRTMVTAVANGTGAMPMIYTSPGFWNRAVRSAEFGDLPLWVAHWNVACPNTPNGWSSWALWQYSSSGFVPGVQGDVDLDQTAGSTLPVYTGAPIFPLLPDRTVLALGPTSVSFTARAVGYLGTPAASSCLPASGSTFPIGTTTVTCTATSSRGATSRSFEVSVQRPAAPEFDASFPVDVVALATGPSGAAVFYGPVVATRFDGGRLATTCLPSSRDMFPVGRTVVECRATDAFGQTATWSFAVSVGYAFSGFFAPVVDPITTVNAASSFDLGSTVPIRFALAYSDGTRIPDDAASTLAAACGATVSLAPWDDHVLTPSGSLAADFRILGCAAYDPETDEFVGDLDTTAARAPGDYTLVAVVSDPQGHQLAARVAEIGLR